MQPLDERAGALAQILAVSLLSHIFDRGARQKPVSTLNSPFLFQVIPSWFIGGVAPNAITKVFFPGVCVCVTPHTVK